MNHLQLYLSGLREIRATGSATKETSYYPVLANLFNAVGATLKPKVRCVIQLANSGAGLPDGGFFTADQTRNADEQSPLLGQKPSRGVVEIKAPSEDIQDIIQTKQIKEYLAFYGQLLVTNYRAFHLLSHYFPGTLQSLESFELAPDEDSFWSLAAHPNSVSPELAQRFEEYLKRVLLHASALNDPKDVAFFLASYARDARARVETAANLEALANIRNALEEALGMKFNRKDGEHFFRSTFVQTLFYGVFSGWVLWHKQKPKPNEMFDWKTAVWHLHVPMIRALFEQIATPTKLGSLGLVEPLDWTAAALNRVNRAAFFANFVETHAVQYFYEPFLRAFDPKLRKELGVWYTPPEIVKYQVERVDIALREQLGISDGLADPRVFVLDPCCGTGAYLVEVLKRIRKTLVDEKGEGALAELTLKEAAQNRIFGFEIMCAPFVVAHLQIGLLLQDLSVPLNDAKGERVGIFLTNALTGWDDKTSAPLLANWPELQAERAGAGRIKQEKPILVVLGNPPYNAFAGVSPAEEQGLVEIYKGAYWERKKDIQGKDIFDEDGQPVMIRRYRLSDPVAKGGWNLKKFNLDELYVRFFRIAERKIAEGTGRGIVSFISNHSWLSEPSFVLLREHLLNSFDEFWIENMHGDRKISEYAPDGRTSETVFALSGFSPGIRQGVAVSLWIKSGELRQKRVFFRDDLNEAKASERRAHLVSSLIDPNVIGHYKEALPAFENRFLFRPTQISQEYSVWPKLTDLCTVRSDGFFEKRGGALIDIDKSALEKRIRLYLEEKVSWDEIKASASPLAKDAARFSARLARTKLLKEDKFDPTRLRRISIRPFDTRWCYYSPIRPLWNEPRPTLWKQCWSGNAFLISRLKSGRSGGSPVYFSPALVDGQVISVNPSAFPLRLRIEPPPAKLSNKNQGPELGSILQEAAAVYQVSPSIRANLSDAAREYLVGLGFKNLDSNESEAVSIWMHSLAIAYSPGYLTENAEGFRLDWPRIPLPALKSALEESARLGRKVADLLNTEVSVEGVTTGLLASELKTIAVLSSAKDLRSTAGWGHKGKGGVVTGGKGKMVTSIVEIGPDSKGPWYNMHDIYLNETTCWKNIPEQVWDFTIGGYQVIKKWLSYREFELLGRALTPDEAREVTHMARRIAALILLQPDLDKNYQSIKANSAPLPKQ